MKNIIYFVVIIACVGLIVFGLTRKTAPLAEQIAKPAGQQQTAASAGIPSAAGQKTIPKTALKTTATSAPVAIGQVAQHYRPDTAEPVSESTATPAEIAERNFQLTPDLLAKMYLVDTYKPGICFGAPATVPQVAIDSLVASNPPLSNFLKQKYGLKTDTEIYNKLKQLQGITLTEIASSRYNFTFMDGQCQTVIYYEGTVTVSGVSISATVASQTSHTYQ